MSITTWLHSFWGNHELASAAAIVANDGIFITMFALAAAAWMHREQRSLLLPLILGAIAGAAIDLTAGRLFFEVRPFAVMLVTPLVAHDPADNSFPSDHAAATAYVAAFLSFVDRRWAIVAIVAAVLVSGARVFCLLHWPQDIIAGWAIGGITGVAAGFYGARWSARLFAFH